jgi:hypothetical protein
MRSKVKGFDDIFFLVDTVSFHKSLDRTLDLRETVDCSRNTCYYQTAFYRKMMKMKVVGKPKFI